MFWISHRSAKKPVIYLEAVVYTILILLACLYFHPSDPLFSQSSFPWIWLISVAIALRAGPIVGLCSYAVILSGFYILAESAFSTLPTQLNLLGGLILTLICGEFSSSYFGRLHQWEQISTYAEQQLDLMSHAYYLLKQSHAHLEQQLITKPTTLRSSMSDLRALIKASGGKFEQTHCEHLMRLLTHYCSIQSCAFYPWKNGTLSTDALCEYELHKPLNIHDPVVMRSIKNKTPFWNAKLNDVDLKSSEYLMAFPVIAFDNTCFALFVVKKMPFFSYHAENFQLIRIMLEYYANSIVLYNHPMPLLKAYPDCPAEFAFELQRMILLKKQIKTTSYLVAIFIDNHSRQDAILYELSQNNRGLDVQWKHKIGSAIVLLIIMPFCEYSDVVGYRNRVKTLPQIDSSISLENPLLRFSSLPIEENSDSIGIIRRMLET